MEESIIISENIINNLDKHLLSYTHVLIITDCNIFNIYQDNNLILSNCYYVCFISVNFWIISSKKRLIV